MKNIIQYSMSDPAVTQCPFNYYAAMREESPVHLDPGTGFYWVSRYNDVISAALDADALSSKSEITLKKTFSPRVQAIWDAAEAKPLDTLVTSDAPEHDDYRRVGIKLFTPAIVKSMIPKIEGLVNGLIDDFIDEGETDFLAHFAGVLPATVIADEFGIPREEQTRFRNWTDAIIQIQTPGISEEDEIEHVKKIIEMFHYLSSYIENVADQDNVGRVMHQLATMNKRDGSPFSTLERIWMTIATFVGGNETTVNTLMMGMRKLALNPDLQTQLYNSPDKVAAFVEELLRTEAPVQAMVRVATRDIEIAGTQIPKGANVILCIGSANYDASFWDGADEFRLDRKNGARHLAFGKGRHVCIGLHLARRELNIAFGILTQRLSNIRLATSEADIEQLPLPFHRAIANLSIKFEAIK